MRASRAKLAAIVFLVIWLLRAFIQRQRSSSQKKHRVSVTWCFALMRDVRMRTVEWDYTRDQLRLIDQRILPGDYRIMIYNDYRDVADAIREMVVRGAPAIGVTAAFGLALAARHSKARTCPALLIELHTAADQLQRARPTANNLSWALKRMITSAEAAAVEGHVNQLRIAILEEAQKLADEDVRTNQEMALFGASLIDDGDTIVHHCNTGSLAAVDWGTALGVIRMAHEQGKHIHVLVDETRPRLQGARLTAWELQQYGISYDIIADGASGYFLSSGQVQKVFFGADRVAANGDVANKIGTYMLALAAHDNQIPVYPVVPISTFDMAAPDGKAIPIEERDQQEVLALSYDGQAVFPSGACARNPAFDITPNRLVTAIVTEIGIIEPPFKRTIKKAVEGKLK
jgi:methylthioribose-1-phosphate isomerase